MTSTAIHALTALLEKAGITPEQLLRSATPTVEEPVVTKADSTVHGINVPAPTPGMKITQEVKKAYNSALSRAGLGTLGAGGATYENLVVKYAQLGGQASPTGFETPVFQNPILALLKERPFAGEAQPSSLQERISNYTPKVKNRVWVKRDGSRIPCTEEQYTLWSSRRQDNEKKRTVTPVLPFDLNVDSDAIGSLLLALADALS